MIRAIGLTIQNEARLLLSDPIVLFMLLLAPVVIIAVAGYSLGDLYGGGTQTFRVPIVDLDRGEAANAIISALKREPSLTLEFFDDPTRARGAVASHERTPLGIEIPAGLTAAISEGRPARLVLIVDPVRRIESDALEIRLAELCRTVTAAAQDRARAQLAKSETELRSRLDAIADEVRKEQAEARSETDRAEARLSAEIRARTAEAAAETRKQIETIVRKREAEARSELTRQLSSREEILKRVQQYLVELKASQHAFDDWVSELKARAGNRAAQIPNPPAFPEPPSNAELAELAKPISIPAGGALSIEPIAASALKLPKLNLPAGDDRFAELARLQPAPALPGSLGLSEQAVSERTATTVNAFDQYVPGFGVTFLLIGMLLGISLTLFDEREWGTLKRLQASGAPLSALLIGKLVARFVVGTIQMALLFAIGWLLFGISLGRDPIALALPTVAISFTSAAFGLVIASIARAHDSVMPLGTVSAMTMSALGGCWWPLDFEPGWMRAIAQWLPTTWTMEAYNNLMIRNLPSSAVLWPFAITIALGLIYLAVGIFGIAKFEE